MLGELGAAHHDGVARAELFGLVGELDARDASELGPDEVGSVTDDDDDPLDARGLEGVDDVAYHGASGDGDEHLGEFAFHARALAGGEDDGYRRGRHEAAPDEGHVA
jgi:hypothetical protein